MDKKPLQTAFFLIDYTPIGGVERVTGNLIRLFKKNNIDVKHLISFEKKNKTAGLNYPSDLTIKVLSGRKKTLCRELSQYLLKNDIQRLIFQADNMSIALKVIEAAKSANCKAFGQYHGSPYAYLRKYIFWEDIKENPKLIFKVIWHNIILPFKKIKQRKFVKTCKNGVVCVSWGAAKELKRLHGDLPQIKTIHNPFELNNVQENFSKKKLVTYVSRLENKHKNSFLVVKTWALINQKHPDWTLQILGDGTLKKKMETFIEKKQINNIIFYGMVDCVEDFLALSKISISTSNTEGLPTAIAEAIVYKNAIAGTHSDGGITDLIGDDCGLISPKNNAECLAENVSKLIQNPSLIKTLSNNAKNNLIKFSDEIIVEKWKKLLFS